jgi:hypothetical protein
MNNADRRTKVGNINTNLKEIEYMGRNWVEVVYGTAKFRAVVNMRMNCSSLRYGQPSG